MVYNFSYPVGQVQMRSCTTPPPSLWRDYIPSPSFPSSPVAPCHFLSSLTAISDRGGWTCRNTERVGNGVWRTGEEEKVKQAAFSQRAVAPETQRRSLLFTLFSCFFVSSLAHLYACYLTHSRHTSRLLLPLPPPSSVLSLNRVVSFPRCWITFSAMQRHCARNPLNSIDSPHSASLSCCV